MKIFGHGDGYAEVEGVAGVAVAVEDEFAGDGALGDLDGGSGGAAEGDWGGDVSDGDVGEAGQFWTEVGAVNFDFSTWHGGCGQDPVEVGGLVGAEEREKWVHRFRRDRCTWLIEGMRCVGGWQGVSGLLGIPPSPLLLLSLLFAAI